MQPTKSSYVALFSGGGLGCYGLKQLQWECVATSELLPRRMEVQKANLIASTDEGYILGDITDEAVRGRLLGAVQGWKSSGAKRDLDLVFATPPCQGMSVANHKKNDELERNSLVVESIRIINELQPKFFLMENVRSFLGTLCTDLDGQEKVIGEAIRDNLAKSYNIASKVINFKDFGAKSSRTRTLVIGARRDLDNTTPWDFFPEPQSAPTLRELLEGLPRISEMGEISSTDIYHAFRTYDPKMRPWISSLKEGESAFQNKDPMRRPHKLVDGVRVEHVSSNGDKYRRNIWDKVAPCVHTRNDILASQNTVHPIDDRVFSIRELMRMMGLDEAFRWSSFELSQLNSLSIEHKREYLREHEVNIRQCLGEGVPAEIAFAVGQKIEQYKKGESRYALAGRFIRNAEIGNEKRAALAAFYTRLDVAGQLISHLPGFASKKTIKILEPSVGAGAFLLPLLDHYSGKRIELTVVDKNPRALEESRKLLNDFGRCDDLIVKYVEGDFFEFQSVAKFDIVLGNPPFGKSKDVIPASTWKPEVASRDIFARFLERAMQLGDYVSFILPKSFLSSPEHAALRDEAARATVIAIDDFGERAFQDIKIETIGLTLDMRSGGEIRNTQVLSYPRSSFRVCSQNYYSDPAWPTWLIYRNDFFDEVASQLQFGVFRAIRDRELSSKHFTERGEIPVVQASRIPRIGSAVGTQKYLRTGVSPNAWASYKDATNALVAPNLSYYPRVMRYPSGAVVDGSAAILLPEAEVEVTTRQMEFFSSDIFFYFYRIARNYSTRSLNIDKTSVFYWGILKDSSTITFDPTFEAKPQDIMKDFSPVPRAPLK